MYKRRIAVDKAQQGKMMEKQNFVRRGGCWVTAVNIDWFIEEEICIQHFDFPFSSINSMLSGLPTQEQPT